MGKKGGVRRETETDRQEEQLKSACDETCHSAERTCALK